MDTGSYTFADLKTKYGGFLVPAAEISVDGTVLDNKVVVAETQVDNTIRNESVSTAVLRVQNAALEEPGKFNILSKFPLAKKLEIKMGFKATLVSVFQGYIFERELSFSPAEKPELIVTCLDCKAFLRLNRSCQVFPDKAKLSDLVSELLTKYSFPNEVTATTALADKMSFLGKEKSDFDMILAIAEETGFEFFAHQDKLYFRKPMSVSGNLITLTAADLFALSMKTSLSDAVSKVELFGYNRDTKTAETVAVEAVPTKIGGGKTAAELLGGIPAAYAANIHMDAKSSKGLEDTAKVFFQKRSLNLCHLTLTTPGLPEMIPGRYLSVKEAEGDVAGTYYIQTVSHRQQQDLYTTQIACCSNTTAK